MPSSISYDTVRESKRCVLNTPIVENKWAENYIKNRKQDIKRYAIDLDLIKDRLPKGSKIFEHGAAPYVFSVALSKTGYNVSAGDLDPDRFKGSEELDIKVIKHNSEVDSLENNSFDAIVFNELFEHCRLDLIQTMEYVYDGLKDGGYLFMTTPNLLSISGIYNLIFKRISYSSARSVYKEWEKLNNIGHMGHVREYTVTDTTNFLKEIGFSIEEVHYRGEFPNMGLKGSFFNKFIKIFPAASPLFTIIAHK